MKTENNVSNAQWELLKILWREAPLSAREIFDRLPEDYSGGLQAVRTLLERLLNKGVVERREVHGIWVFVPLLRQNEAVRRECRGFLQRFFMGKAEAGAAYFIEDETISQAELLRLKHLVESKLKEI